MQPQLAHYHIQTLLGEGSFATVYRAFDQKFEREVALKVLKPVWQSDAQAVERFYREAKIVARLHHPHIVSVYDFGQAEGELYLAQRLIEGETLAARLKRGRLTWSEMLALLEPLASALDYAHGQGVIHRDLKPANILLDQKGTLFLGDFGLVRAAEGSVLLSTSAGGMIGTPAYMAPELWDEQPATTETDVYALSCIVVEMLTGRVLFDASTLAAAAKQHSVEGPKLPAQWPADVPAGLGQVLERALAREPADRYSTAGALAQALAELPPTKQAARATASPHPAPTPKSEPVARPPQPRSSGWLWVGGGLLIVMGLMSGVGLIIAAWGGSPGQPETVTRVETVIVEKERVVTVEVEPEVEQNVPVAVEDDSPTHTPQPPTPTSAPPTNTPQPPTPTPAPQLGLGSTGRREADGMTMVYVPAGDFTMGSGESDSLAEDDEKPAHRVTLEAFWLDQTEVTNAQYSRCVEAGVCEESEYAADSTYNGADYPVVGVSWHNAVTYCEWAGGRLPTEAEWEYAARGPESRLYPWGDEAPTCELAEFYGCSGRTIPVGSLADGASWVGALDMSGNAWEWVADWYGTYPATAQTNPTGPDSGEYRVLRGGGWPDIERSVRAASRGVSDPHDRYDLYGFRCVGSPGN